MHVLGIDPRVTERPACMADLAPPSRLEERLGEADFVILTTPETPDTVGVFNTRLFTRMKRGGYFINIARGRCVVTADLVEALRSGHLAGAGLDVADPEPLPPDHPLWSMPNVLITPHVAIYGTPYREKWEAMLIENCRRFAAGQPLLNLVDKEKVVLTRLTDITANSLTAIVFRPPFAHRWGQRVVPRGTCSLRRTCRN
jgi:phosphoglycerate dehydrogenase-like enzyme